MSPRLALSSLLLLASAAFVAGCTAAQVAQAEKAVDTVAAATTQIASNPVVQGAASTTPWAAAGVALAAGLALLWNRLRGTSNAFDQLVAGISTIADPATQAAVSNAVDQATRVQIARSATVASALTKPAAASGAPSASSANAAPGATGASGGTQSAASVPKA